MSRNKAISEVFLKSVKADLEISYDEEIQGEDVLNTRGSPPAKQKWDKANGKSQKCIVFIDLDVSVRQLPDKHINTSMKDRLPEGKLSETTNISQ